MNAVPSGRARAGGQDRGDGRTGGEPAGGHGRQVDRRADDLQQRQQTEVTGRAVVERTAMAAGLHALHDEGVGADPRRREGLVAGRHGHPHRRADLCSAATTSAGGQPNVNETTATRASRTMASLSSQPSSSWRGSPGATP
jgi:hypothetical protein